MREHMRTKWWAQLFPGIFNACSRRWFPSSWCRESSLSCWKFSLAPVHPWEMFYYPAFTGIRHVAMGDTIKKPHLNGHRHTALIIFSSPVLFAREKVSFWFLFLCRRTIPVNRNHPTYKQFIWEPVTSLKKPEYPGIVILSAARDQ